MPSFFYCTKFRWNSELDGQCVSSSVKITGGISFRWSTGSDMSIQVDGNSNIKVESATHGGVLRFVLKLKGRLAGLIYPYEFDVEVGTTYTTPIHLYGGANSAYTGDDFSITCDLVYNGGFAEVINELILEGATHRYG